MAYFKISGTKVNGGMHSYIDGDHIIWRSKAKADVLYKHFLKNNQHSLKTFLTYLNYTAETTIANIIPNKEEVQKHIIVFKHKQGQCMW